MLLFCSCSFSLHARLHMILLTSSSPGNGLEINMCKVDFVDTVAKLSRPPWEGMQHLADLPCLGGVEQGKPSFSA